MPTPNERISFPQSTAIYAEEKDVFGTLMNALQEILVQRPPNPVQALLRLFMRHSQSALKLAIIGPPFSGRTTLALQLAHVFDVPLLDYERLYEAADPQLRVVLDQQRETHEPLPPELAFSLLRQRIFQDDCIEKGWILCGFPETRAQDEVFRKQGIWPQKIIILSVAREHVFHRRRHYRYDPVEKRPYSAICSLPMDREVRHRLITPEHQSKLVITRKMRQFGYEAVLIMKSALSLSKEDPCCIMIDANRAIDAVYNDALRFVCVQAIDRRPYMHRIIFLGLPGSGKKTMANRFSEIFRLHHVSSGDLIMQAASNPDDDNFREFNALLSKNKPIPDESVGEMINKALRESELQGYILRGFPRNITQAEMLNRLGFSPSRVFFFNCSPESTTERLMSRAKELYEKSMELQDLYGETQTRKRSSGESNRRLGFLDIEAQRELVEAKNAEYLDNVNDLRNFYRDVSYDIDASQPIEEIFGQIKFHLLHPLPLRPKQDVLPMLTPQIVEPDADDAPRLVEPSGEDAEPDAEDSRRAVEPDTYDNPRIVEPDAEATTRVAELDEEDIASAELLDIKESLRAQEFDMEDTPFANPDEVDLPLEDDQMTK